MHDRVRHIQPDWLVGSLRRAAEYVTRNEPYDMVFECRKCGQRQVIPDLD